MAPLLDTPALTRREFTEASIKALFVGMAVTLTACGGGGGGSASAPTAPTPTPTPPPPAQTGDKTGTITANHGHAATVTSVQVQAGGAVELNIKGAADHDHLVQLSADDVRQIAAGAKVTKTSTAGGAGVDDGYGNKEADHNHSVAFN